MTEILSEDAIIINGRYIKRYIKGIIYQQVHTSKNEATDDDNFLVIISQVMGR